MSESSQSIPTTTQALVEASGIPSEMLPLLAEMAQADADGQYITLALPMDQETSNSVEVISQDQPSTSEHKVVVQESPGPTPKGKSSPGKGKEYKKSRAKRRKMEAYIRENKKFVYIGKELTRWDRYRKELRFKNDAEFAKVLLDGFRKYTKVVQLVVGPTFGYPEIGNTDKSSLQPNVEPREESGSDADLVDYIQEIRKAVSEGGDTGVLEGDAETAQDDAKMAAEAEMLEAGEVPAAERDGETSRAVEVLMEDGDSMDNEEPPEEEEVSSDEEET